MKKILLIKLSSLGDVIFNIPLANMLKDNGYNVTWLVSDKGKQVIQNNPCVDKTIYIPSKCGLIDFIKVIKQLRKEKFDIAIDSQMMFKSLFYLAFCGAKRRITSKKSRELAWLGGNELVEDISYHPNINIVMNYLNYAKYLGCDVSEDKIKVSLPESSLEQKSYVDNLLAKINPQNPTVVIAPATTWVNKHWNPDNWREVVKFLNGKSNLIFTGGAGDVDLINYISQGVGINLAGKTGILDLVEIFKRSSLVIAPDSGSSYLAWASGVPKVITIFTCTPKEILKPLGDKNKYFACGNDYISCQPCFKRKCKIKEKNKCTFYPNADIVIEKIKEFIC